MWPLLLLLGGGENSEEDGAAAAWSSWGWDRSDMIKLGRFLPATAGS